MEICNLPNKQFKIAVLRKLNKLHKNIEEKFTKIRKKIHEQMRSSVGRKKTLKENVEILRRIQWMKLKMQ